MPKIQYKEKEGTLHIGGGRFFYAQKPVEVSVKEKDELLKKHSDLEEVKEMKEAESPKPKE